MAKMYLLLFIVLIIGLCTSSLNKRNKISYRIVFAMTAFLLCAKKLEIELNLMPLDKSLFSYDWVISVYVSAVCIWLYIICSTLIRRYKDYKQSEVN